MALKHHAAFTIPAQSVSGSTVTDHFRRLGYEVADEGPDEWVFRRGSKLAVLYRFDIRAYSTRLVVRAKAKPEGGSWVSCDFDVWTFMTLLFHSDVATLEAEARELESVLRQNAEPSAAPSSLFGGTENMMQEKKPFAVRYFIAMIFGLMIVFGVQYKMSGTAKRGSYTQLFDTGMIIVGILGVSITLLWPRRKRPDS